MGDFDVKKGKPKIAGMVRDGKCFFCHEDDGMSIALTPLKRDKISGDALYLCDDCFTQVVIALTQPSLGQKVRVCPKCGYSTPSKKIKKCAKCKSRLRSGLLLIMSKEA